MEEYKYYSQIFPIIMNDKDENNQNGVKKYTINDLKESNLLNMSISDALEEIEKNLDNKNSDINISEKDKDKKKLI